MRQRLLRLALVFVIVTALGVIAFTAVAHAAGTNGGGAPVTTISIKPEADLVTTQTGPGANATVAYSCFPRPAGGKGGNFVQVSLTDLQGHSGFGVTAATCDDKTHTATVFVPTFNGAFVAGDAVGNGTVCGAPDCASTQREVRLS